jgi:hypothetical protein
MPLLALNDDCLGEIASWLPAREMVLSFGLSCKVSRSVVREDLVDEAIVAEHPFIGGLPGRGRAVVRQAYCDLTRVAEATGARQPPTRRALRTLDEFRFLVAVGREGAAAQLDFVEVKATLVNGNIELPWSGQVVPDELAVYVVVVDGISGRMERLADAAVCEDIDGDSLYLEWVDFPGQVPRFDGDSRLMLPGRLDITEDSDPYRGGTPLTAANLSLSCVVYGVDDGIGDCSGEDFLRAIADLLA